MILDLTWWDQRVQRVNADLKEDTDPRELVDLRVLKVSPTPSLVTQALKALLDQWVLRVRLDCQDRADKEDQR